MPPIIARSGLDVLLNEDEYYPDTLCISVAFRLAFQQRFPGEAQAAIRDTHDIMQGTRQTRIGYTSGASESVFCHNKRTRQEDTPLKCP